MLKGEDLGAQPEEQTEVHFSEASTDAEELVQGALAVPVLLVAAEYFQNYPVVSSEVMEVAPQDFGAGVVVVQASSGLSLQMAAVP